MQASSTLHRRRAAELEDLLLVLQWADLHGDDPRRGPGGERTWAGEDRLVEIGGDGTPEVRELCLPELAIAREVHPLSVRSTMADALDLRHRLPLTWAVVLEGGCESWVARKVASLSRKLDRFQVAIVDSAVSDAIGGESPGRVLQIAEAKVIEADRAGHRARLEAELRRRWVRLGATDEHGLRNVIARVEAGDAVWVDAIVDRVADILATRPDLTQDLPPEPSKDELRAVAFGWLAHPEDLLALLNHPAGPVDTEAPSGHERSVTVVYVHLHQAAVEGAAAGVARVEGIGPMLLEQLRRLVGHARIVVKPVIDLNQGASVNAYEHPEAVKERTHLRTCGEIFPHAARTSRHLDVDHPDPYQPHGPPGQTGDHNAAPLGRTNHRAKTHLGYRLTQTGLGSYVWRSPHGLHRHVDSEGTHVIDQTWAAQLIDPGALDCALERIRADLAS